MANNWLDCPDMHSLHYLCNLEPLALRRSCSSLNFLCFSLFAMQIIDNLYNFNQQKILNYIWVLSVILQSFPGGSDGKESASHEGDLGSVAWLGRSPGKWNGNPVQYSCPIPPSIPCSPPQKGTLCHHHYGYVKMPKSSMTYPILRPRSVLTTFIQGYKREGWGGRE